tara:strand:+ start:457 stop:654 length:198 start_codon:yes stop_codon:yes gene_type:complete
MPKYKVTATKGVGYTAIIEADSQDEALRKSRGWGYSKEVWRQIPQSQNAQYGNDWTIENIWEIKE